MSELSSGVSPRIYCYSTLHISTHAIYYCDSWWYPCCPLQTNQNIPYLDLLLTVPMYSYGLLQVYTAQGNTTYQESVTDLVTAEQDLSKNSTNQIAELSSGHVLLVIIMTTKL